MAKPFSNLREGMSEEAANRAQERTAVFLDVLALSELRQQRSISQEQLAGVLGVRQAAVSKLERRPDIYISSLRSYIEALGGELEIHARFPEGSMRIRHFEGS